MPPVQPSAAALLLLSTAAVSFLGTAGATSGSPSSIPAAPATMQGDLGVNQQCSVRVWTMSATDVAKDAFSLVTGGETDAGATSCDGEPDLEGGCLDTAQRLGDLLGEDALRSALDGQSPEQYCSDLCSRSCYGGFWFNSPCDTHYSPLVTIQIHCPVPWGLVAVVVILLVLRLLRSYCDSQRSAAKQNQGLPVVGGSIYVVPAQAVGGVGVGVGVGGGGRAY
jgi:hypothetical protein